MVSQTSHVILFGLPPLGGPVGGSGVPTAPNGHRVAEDRRECYWLSVVTNCNVESNLTTIKDPARLVWQEVTKVQHYTLPSSLLGAQG